jgi:predicted esterase
VSERTIAATVHGRYLVEEPDGAPVLAGFHGYAENADIQMERLRGIAGSERWLKISIQGLHRFYQRRTSTVVASWMTAQNREQSIADNTAYVASCIDAVAPGAEGVVFAGFSQGVAMAFRAAARSRRRVAGVIAVGGDVPPELEAEELRRMGAVLIVRGSEDGFYTAQMFERDQQRLRDAGVDVQALELAIGHEWNEPVAEASGDFLGRLGRPEERSQ